MIQYFWNGEHHLWTRGYFCSTIGEVSEKKIHDKKEIIKAHCTITTDSFEDYFKCTEQGIFNKDFLYKTLSDLSGEWGINPNENE